MATSPVSPLTSQLNHEAVNPKSVLPKSPFMSGSKLFSSNMPCSTVPRRTRRLNCFASAKDMSFDHIPKLFRGDNLKDGVMQNFKNVPQAHEAIDYGIAEKIADSQDSSFEKRGDQKSMSRRQLMTCFCLSPALINNAYTFVSVQNAAALDKKPGVCRNCQGIGAVLCK
ncbi:hypothetical protein EUTSA_v10011829mg [Eutrema salsugineum]|uniref:Uncharacterized protein n=1 Tax=Eutrema salsugineum TaxID=72664 RepID=V4KLP9_EUTSA|nr:hypothetical protein EUTSA_v10011829mg [Eutrema salsugineum]